MTKIKYCLLNINPITQSKHLYCIQCTLVVNYILKTIRGINVMNHSISWIRPYLYIKIWHDAGRETMLKLWNLVHYKTALDCLVSLWLYYSILNRDFYDTCHMIIPSKHSLYLEASPELSYLLGLSVETEIHLFYLAWLSSQWSCCCGWSVREMHNALYKAALTVTWKPCLVNSGTTWWSFYIQCSKQWMKPYSSSGRNVDER